MADGGELAIGLFHDVGLGDDRQVGLAVVLGILKGGAGDAAGAEIRGDLEIDRHAVELHTPAAQDILALGVLPVEHPVDVLLGDADGADIGIQIQLPAHGHIGRLQGAAVGGLGGALQDDVAALDGGEDIVGDGLTLGLAVFDGEASVK